MTLLAMALCGLGGFVVSGKSDGSWAAFGGAMLIYAGGILIGIQVAGILAAA